MKVILHDLIKIEGIVDADNQKHSNLLKIGKENIEDLNRRLGNSLEIIYNAERHRYEPSDYTDESNYQVVELLNKYIHWSLTTGKELNFQLNTYLQGIENSFNNLKTELHYIKITNGINDRHRLMVHQFINEFYDFSPKGLFSEKEISEIQKKLNAYCKALELEFLNENELELNLGETEKEIKLINSPSEKSFEKQYTFDFSTIPFFNKFFKTTPINLQ